MMKQKLNQRGRTSQKGITLVALVITIIVLLILAGVTINMVLGDNGIIKQAEEGTEKYREQAIREKVELAIGTYNIEKYNNGTLQFKTFIESELGGAKVLVDGKIKYSGYKFTVENENKIATMEKVVPAPAPIVSLSNNSMMDEITTTTTITNSGAQTDLITDMIFNYYIKLASSSEYTLISTKNENTNTFTGLNQASSYMIKVEVINTDNVMGIAETTAGTACFLVGTQVATETGMKNIEDIKLGDNVYSINIDNNEKELKEVTKIFNGKTNEVYKIHIGEEIVEVTPRHQFYIMDKGWIRAYELEEGDCIVAKDNDSMAITKIEHQFLDEPVAVYNLTVEGYHNYLVTQYELLVHNLFMNSVT